MEKNTKSARWDEAAQRMERDLSFAPTVNPSPRVLTPAQIADYNTVGYLKPFRLFDEKETAANRAFFDWLLAEIKARNDGRDSYAVNGYHQRCRSIYDLVVHPRILDLVEDLLGPNFVGWGTHYFCKMPGDPKKVPWHQDASYWPFDKARTVTVWLAIDDADPENAAMQFLPATHNRGLLKWSRTRDPAVLDQQIDNIETYGTPVYDSLKAGELSLHADMLAHGSDANRSTRRRCGLTIRYCPVTVRAQNEWNRQSIWCRGSDPSGHWANLPRPAGDDPSPADWQKPIGAN